MATQKTNNKPVQKFTQGAVRASVWENTGPNGPFFTATLERRFRDAAGNWRTANNYGERQLENLLNAALEAKEWMENQGRPRP